MRAWYKGLKSAIDTSPFTKPQRFGSFAPQRSGSQATFYIDGEHYMYALSEAISQAKETILIEDWWLSPELYFRRPPRDNSEWRLDRLLQRKAEEGVHIYVFMYKEVAISLPLDSLHSKRTLKGLHKNIHVQRHPDHAPGGTFFWAHHEKYCVIDRRVAFVGGIDLCYGRWDTNAHRLADLPVEHQAPEDYLWPGQDYNNARVKDFANVQNYNETLVNRQLTPRMPWHDTSIRITGQSARDTARHFIERWNFVKALKAKDRVNIPYLVPDGEFVASRKEEDLTGSCRVQLCRSSAEWSSGIGLERSIQNAYRELILNAEHFVYMENQFFITTTEPDDSNGTVKNGIGAALVERILRAHQEGTKFKAIILIPLMPAFEAEIDSPAASTLKLIMHWQYMSMVRGGNSIYDKLREQGVEPRNYIRFYSLRNYDLFQQTPSGPSNVVEDYDEERDAALRKEAAEGGTAEIPGISTEEGQSLASSLKPRSEKGEEDGKSTIEKPKVLSVARDIDDELVREEEDAQLEESMYVSELVYIHCKLLIVDDRIALCGSANINDRSQCGNRDSELAAIVEDEELISCKMNGQDYKARKFAKEYRLQMCREHLGILPHTDMRRLAPAGEEIQISSEDESYLQWAEKAIQDPLSDDFDRVWQGTAQSNTEIFRRVFRCVPDDTVTTFDAYKKFIPDPTKVLRGHVADESLSKEETRTILDTVRGQLVEFPTEFLKDENLSNTSISPEKILPIDVFI
ncbi:MAG: hypothetical protein DHS80DRAFT_13629 [Piptocephalis tieghemiana]|nr:MAG: hypothetical protein DHS80DRAFT_13629 [Piptocephalis tieghemiana]